MSRFQNSQRNNLILRFYPVVVLGLIFAGICYGYRSSVVFGESNISAKMEIANRVENNGKNVVCLDPGHGGDDDPGAVNGDVVERDINLAVAEKTKKLLESENYVVYLTRENADAVGDNKDRAIFCNEKNADILISIHHNDYTDSDTDYAVALYYKDIDVEFAGLMLDAVSKDLNVTSNGLESFEDNVLIKSDMPSVLLEPFFVSSDYELGQILSGSRLDDEAKSIVSGVDSYFAK